MFLKRFLEKLRGKAWTFLLSLYSLPAFAEGSDPLSQLNTSLTSMNSSLLSLIQGPVAFTMALVSVMILVLKNSSGINIPSFFSFFAVIVLLTSGVGLVVGLFA